MTIEELMPFCSKDNTRNITKPFSDEQYTYATNGYVMIRVDRIDDVPISSPVSLEHLKGFFVCIPSIPIPKIKITTKTCPKCEGEGKITKCPECGGEGSLDLDSAYHTYEVECKMCDGEGTLPEHDKTKYVKTTCDACHGEGKIVDDSVRVAIDGIPFAAKVLEPISKLVNVKFFVRQEYAPATFSFDGGTGIVMPRYDPIRA